MSLRRLVIASGAIHALAFAGLLATSRGPAEASAPLPRELDVELGVEPPPGAPAAEERVEDPRVAMAAERAPAGSDARSSARTAPAPTSRGPAGPEAAPQEPAGPEPQGTVILTAPPVLGGIASANPFAMNGALPSGATADVPGVRPVPGKTTAQAKEDVEQSLKMTLRERDVAVGLSPEGPVLTALRDATMGSAAPERGKARFGVSVDASGTITALRLLSSVGGEQGWEDARKRALLALVGQKLALRGAKGAELTIELTSDVTLPSNSKALFRPTNEPTRIRTVSDAPGADGPASVMNGRIVGRFDLADIGARKARIVHSRLVALDTR